MTARIQAVQLPDAIAVLRRRQGERIAGERGVELAALVDQVGEAAERSHHAVYLQAWLAIVPRQPMVAPPLQSRGRTPISGGSRVSARGVSHGQRVANDGAVQEQIDSTIEDAIARARSQLPVARA
ncbi:hypothetical protein CSC43_6935 [Pseudomonas aeruginosa]|nr:hypothetical protein CSC43_6935 [Pseudomonas aeruginosa]